MYNNGSFKKPYKCKDYKKHYLWKLAPQVIFFDRTRAWNVVVDLGPMPEAKYTFEKPEITSKCTSKKPEMDVRGTVFTVDPKDKSCGMDPDTVVRICAKIPSPPYYQNSNVRCNVDVMQNSLERITVRSHMRTLFEYKNESKLCWHCIFAVEKQRSKGEDEDEDVRMSNTPNSTFMEEKSQENITLENVSYEEEDP